jgi:hypothetical protein
MNKKYDPFQEDEDDEGGSGGQSGAIEFHDFIGTGESARDKLPQREKDRLLSIHDAATKDHVEKQQEKRKQYEDLKNGKRSLAEHRQEKMQRDQFQSHPLLANDPRKSGLIDNNMSPDPNENTNEANNELQLQLQNQLQNKLQHQFENKKQPPRLTR